jgi:hypothetical protein
VLNALGWFAAGMIFTLLSAIVRFFHSLEWTNGSWWTELRVHMLVQVGAVVIFGTGCFVLASGYRSNGAPAPAGCLCPIK